MALKLTVFVVDSLSFHTDNEISVSLGLDDFELDNDDEIEVDEFENINTPQEDILVETQEKSTTSFSLITIDYRKLHLEFSTPPPKFV